jgi:eukaryotic-like serine/threonine-protein kinase
VRETQPSCATALTLGDGRHLSIQEALGRGCYGTVYRGLLESGWGVRRPVAVKVFSLPGEIAPDEAIQHLAKVARRAVAVRHSTFVEVLEVDRMRRAPNILVPNGGAPFAVTELVEGESLATLVQTWRAAGTRVPIDFATVVGMRAAEALSAALFTDGVDGSLTNLVHGDLSPRQILVSSAGDVKVGDFGLSAIRDTCSHVRSRSRLAYTAPEVATGYPATARSDVFSLGIILHELLIGPRFASGTTMVEAARMVRDGHIYASPLEPNLPRTFRAIVETATAIDPGARYPHARSMAFDLRREMLRLGLCDAQTCIRHAIVGWQPRSSAPPARPSPPAPVIPITSAAPRRPK